MNLVIVESPAKCQKIQGFLGAGWRVIASLGHIRALKQDLTAIGLTTNFEPSYEWIKEKAKTIAQLKEAAKGAKQVYLAADRDREGEAIAYSVCLLLKLDPKTALRATFTEITETAIKHAIANPTQLDMNQVHAQQARAMLDMMIGFTISPLLWKHVAASLSAGRCQTPALRLVMEREQQIENFRSESSWVLSLECNRSRFIMDDELEDEESAVNYLEQVHPQPIATVVQTSIRPWMESAPPPLITSTFQQQASALYSINPKNAMKIAQKLYEAGHITYMRTDKAVLSEEATMNASTWVKENYGEEYVQTNAMEAPPKKAKKAKGPPKDGAPKAQSEATPLKGQEAHEAIRPTHVEQVEIEGDPYEKKLYKLIWQRAVQSVMSAAKGEIARVQVQVKDDEFLWTSTEKRTIFDGWKRAGAIKNIDLNGNENDNDEKEDTSQTQSQWKYVSSLEVGDEVKWTHMTAEPKETKAQGRFTEATLVRELEHHGMGRPSTFASLLYTIQERGYVEHKDIPGTNVLLTEYSICPAQWPATKTQTKKKVGAEKNKLVPTELGRSVLRFLLQHFDDLFAYGFTATVEAQLDHVAQGLTPWKQVLQDMWSLYKERYQTLSSTSVTIATNKVKEFIIPNKGLIKAVQSKKGPLLLSEGKTKEDTVFYGWPSGIAFEDMTEAIAATFIQLKQSEKDGSIIGEYEGESIVKKTGKFGTYIQCGTVSIPYQEEAVEKIIEKLAAKKEVKQGEVTFKEYVIRTGQYGPYIMKTSLKKPQFVSLPKGVNPTTLTEKEVEALYKLGLEAKKSWKKEKKI